MKPGFIGIDIATQSARALLVDENADTLAIASADLAQVIRGPDGAVTQDPQSWVLAVTSMLSEIQSKAKSLGVKPISLVISATSGTFTLVNESGTDTHTQIQTSRLRDLISPLGEISENKDLSIKKNSLPLNFFLIVSLQN